MRLADLVRRPELSYEAIAPFDPERPGLSRAVTEEVEICLRYAGYIEKQRRQIEEFRRLEARSLPPDADYGSVEGLRLEARQKLSRIRPENLGQAGRISGVSPADVAALIVWLGKQKG